MDFEFTSEAREMLETLSSANRMKVFQTLQKLLIEDIPYGVVGVRKLANANNICRIRVGNYRLLFKLVSQEGTHLKITYKGTLIIEDIGHRKDIYKKI